MKRKGVFLGICILTAVVWMAAPPAVYGQEDGAVSSVGTTAVYKDQPMTSEGELLFFVDTAGFQGRKGYTLQEVYVLIDAKQLQFIPEGGHYVAQMDMSVAVTDSAGQRVKSEVWTRNVSIKGPSDIQEASAPFRDLIGFDLLPGEYHLTFTVEDIYGDKQGTCKSPIRVHGLEGDKLVTSDILFASQLERTETEGRFVRYGWNVVPNTTRNYLAGRALRFYFEIYNLKVQPDKPKDSFILGYTLTDSSGNPVKTYPPKRLAKPGKSIVKTDTLDTEGLGRGGYYLQVEAFDQGSREHVRSRRTVYLAAPQQAAPEELTEAQMNQLRYYRDIRYIAGGKDLKMYKSLPNQDAKDRFLRQFWKKQDPTPGTPMNERLIEHMRRMQHTENNFSGAHGQLGSDTDKGRVFIKYGPPDDTEYNTAAAGQKPYEIWTYEQQGRYEFIFRDRRGNGVYELVHSTYPGELYNPGWEEEY